MGIHTPTHGDSLHLIDQLQTSEQWELEDKFTWLYYITCALNGKNTREAQLTMENVANILKGGSEQLNYLQTVAICDLLKIIVTTLHPSKSTSRISWSEIPEAKGWQNTINSWLKEIYDSLPEDVKSKLNTTVLYFLTAEA